MTAEYQSIKTKRTFEIVVSLLKEKIFSGEKQPGDRLPTERDMARMAEVSRSAVREAYHALEMLGIVEIRKGASGGTFIREPSHDPITQNISNLIRLRRISLSEITETRLLMEKNIAELALKKITPEDFLKLEQCVEDAMDHVKKGIRAREDNIRFHICLAEISRNKLLLTVYSSVMDLFNLLLKEKASLEMSEIIAQEHKEIIRLLRNGETRPLLDCLDKHIRKASERLVD
ncbi:FCD domain-containing protein [Desulfobacula sp.]|uniref:FadR/GntR family transcriptional regulator n=1 Tax=Desulfobacula sp. TaxID=2593537 RepID=UPI00260CDE36|nr:FCD domain-containing protein [Desulfobacula sp.]